jgi:hypothetical protein
VEDIVGLTREVVSVFAEEMPEGFVLPGVGLEGLDSPALPH